MEEGDGDFKAYVETLHGSVGRCVLQKHDHEGLVAASHPSTQEVEVGRCLSSRISLHMDSETLSETSVRT